MAESISKTTLIIRTVKVICFSLIFVLIMAVLNFCVAAPNTESKKAWKAYYEKDNIDTLMLGTSVSSILDAEYIDMLSDFHTINMSTPNQLYKTNLEALKAISDQQQLKRVILITELDTVSEAEDYISHRLFMDAMYERSPIIDRLAAGFSDRANRYVKRDYRNSPDSINVWVDWVMCPARSIIAIKDVISAKKEYLFVKPELGNHVDINTSLYDRNDYIRDDEAQKLLASELEELDSYNISSIEIDNNAYDYLDQILGYLKANDIPVYVIISPHRLDERQMYGDEYKVLDKFLDNFVSERGGIYYNFDDDDEIRQELDSKDCFKDAEHLNTEGSIVLSQYIAKRVE